MCQNHIVWDAVEVVDFTRMHTANVYEATNDQYTEFLNAVAATDTNALTAFSWARTFAAGSLKAAFHHPFASGGDSDDYWLYPTASNGVPTIAAADATGDISNPGANVVNYDFGADWNGQDGNVTTVGSAGALSESFYGTSDPSGNVTEWSAMLTGGGTTRGLHGGRFFDAEMALRSSSMNGGNTAAGGSANGFRVASPALQSDVPTVSEWGVAVMSLLLLTAGTIVYTRRYPLAA